jgi:PRC-barrel domain
MHKSPSIQRLFAAICVMSGAALFAATGLTAYGENKSLNLSPLIGLAVLAADGVEVGKVVGVSTAPDGRVERIRVLTTTPGLGSRTVIIAQPAFTLRRGAVMLVLSAEVLQGLPAAMAQDDAAR